MKTLNLIVILLVLVGCSKEEQPAPIEQTQTTTTVTENNYLLTLQEVGSLTVYHKIYLNGNEKTSNSFNVKTNDILTGYSFTVASNGNTIGVIVDLEGNEVYNNVEYKAQNDTLFHNYTIN